MLISFGSMAMTAFEVAGAEAVFEASGSEDFLPQLVNARTSKIPKKRGANLQARRAMEWRMMDWSLMKG